MAFGDAVAGHREAGEHAHRVQRHQCVHRGAVTSSRSTARTVSVMMPLEKTSRYPRWSAAGVESGRRQRNWQVRGTR